MVEMLLRELEITTKRIGFHSSSPLQLRSNMEESNTVTTILKALRFAAIKHRDQRRKDAEVSPYINHPIEVAELLARVGGVTDSVILQGAILHDTIEDTETTPEELEAAFGPEARRVVEEVTDDKRLPKAERTIAATAPAARSP